MTVIRLATPEDADTIKEMILQLADFQEHASDVRTNADVLRRQLAQPDPPFECLIAEVDQQPVGFALFYSFYSTWEGTAGLFLEDLYVSDKVRGQGIGKILLSKLSEIATNRGCTRLDWMVQNSNRGAQTFYANFGAKMLPDWSRWRFELPPAAPPL
jgi:GNAT superfamily N-acetyltransferase